MLKTTKTFDKGYKAECYREELFAMGIAYNVEPVRKTDDGYVVAYDIAYTNRTIREI